MSIICLLSSQVGDRTEATNREAAQRCIAEPALLGEIAESLGSRDAALAGDCAEVMTKAAEVDPALIMPYAEPLTALLAHKTTRVRWEAMHALALASPGLSDVLLPLLPRLSEMLRKDGSTIVRDYAVDALGGLGAAGQQQAEAVYPLLREAVTLWQGKHLARVLDAMANVARQAPELALEIVGLGYDYADHAKPTVKKAARRLIRSIE
jgi:HEAT repeat protein